MENINHIQDVLIQMHSGQWFGWSDPSNRVYENLVINGDYEKPTQEFLESELARLQAEYDSQAYSRNRKAEYPTTDELVVALWEAVIEERMASSIDLQGKRTAIKEKHPK